MVSLAEALSSEYTSAVLKIMGSMAMAWLVHFVLTVYMHAAAKKTKTKVDDELLEVLAKPFYFLVLVIGLQWAFSSLAEISAYINILNQVFYVLYIIIIALVITRLISTLLSHWLQIKGKYEKTPKLISNTLTVIIFLIAILVVLGHFDVKITPLLATLGLGGLAVGLALQSTLANLFGGFHMISDKPINVGDFVEIEGKLSGYVEDIGWRTTRIRKVSNSLVIVPNAKLADSIIVNYSLPNLETSCVVRCGVGYGEDLEKVEKVTIAAAKRVLKRVEGAIPDYKPFIRFKEFGDSNINFITILRVKKYTDRFILTHEFIKELKKAFDKHNIEISWPVMVIHNVK